MRRSLRNLLISFALVAASLAVLTGAAGAVALRQLAHDMPSSLWPWLGVLLAASLLGLGLAVFVITRVGRPPAARVVGESESRRRILDRLEAQRQIERHISEQLDLEQLLVIVAGSALRLIGGTFSVVYLREGDVLRARAWADIADIIMREATIPIGTGVTGHAVATGEGLIVNDYPNSPLAAAPWSGLSMRLLAQPLLAGGRALGVMVISRDDTTEPFTPDDLSALADFATQAVVAIENARLFAETKRTAADYQALFEVAGLVGSTLDVDRLLDLIVDRCRALVGVASAGIFSLDPDTGLLTYERGVGLSAEFVDALRVRVGEGTSGRAVRERTPVWTADILGDPAVALTPGTRELVLHEGYRAVLSVPILSQGEPRGVLSAYWWEPHTPSASEVALMSAFAGQAGIALENARLYGAATARGKQLATLARLTETLTATLAIEDILSRVVHSAVELFGSSVAGLWLVDEDGQSLTLRAHAGAHAPLTGSMRFRVGEGLMGGIVASRSPMIVQDLRVDPRVKNVESVHAESAIAFAGVPLVLGDRVLGALSIALRETRRFAEEELSLLHSLANHAAIGIENARLFGEAARQADRMRAVAELGRTLVSSLDVNDILETVATRARDTLEVSHVGICLQAPESGELRFVWGPELAPGFIQAHALELGEGVAGRVVSEGRPVWTSSILDDPLIHLRPETRERIEGIGTRAVLGLPLAREHPFGALIVHREAGHRFTEPEIDYLSVFASQVAEALDNARLYAALDDRATRLRTLARLTNMMSSSLDANAVLQAIARAAAEIMRVPFVAVYVADEATGMLELRAASDEKMGDDLPQKRRRIGQSLVGWVAEHRQPLTVADALTDERAHSAEWASRHGLRGFFGVPILFQDSLLGVLALNDRVPFHLSPDDESLLESFVSQAAVAIRNARLYAETAQHLEETRALLDVAEILDSTLDPRQLLKRVAIKIAQVCRVDRCSIERWEGDQVIPLMSQFVDGRRDERLWAAFLALPRSAPREVPAYALAVETRRPVVVADASASDLFPRQWVDTFGYKSVLVVPLIRQDAVIGVISLDYVERVTPFESWQVDLAMAIAGQLALAIENRRLYGEAQERLRETTTLLAVAQVLSEPGPADEVLRRVARAVARAFSADSVGVYLVDARKEALVPAAGYHVPKHLLEVITRRPFQLARLPMLQEAWQAGRVFHSFDVTNDPRLDRDTFEGVDPHSGLFAPTMVRGEPVGALFLVWWGTGREFQPAEIRLLEGVASQVGLAMENAELARQTQAKLEETERLLSISRTLASTLDLETLPRQFLRHVVTALGADTGGMWLLDGGGEWMEALAGYHVPPDRLDDLRRVRLSIVQHPFYAEAARTRRPVVSTDVMRDPRIPPELCGAAPHRTQLFVPIIAKDRIVGGYGVMWWEASREPSEGELRVMEAIASQAGVALENARLFRDNQRRVEELSVLHELSRAVTGQLDQADLLDTIEQQVARLLDVRHIVILFDDEVDDHLEVVLRVKDGARPEGERRHYARSAAGLSGVVLGTARPLRTDDYIAECARHHVDPVPENFDLPHWLGVPMVAGNRTLGVLALRSRDRTFTEADQRLLANIADLAALALRSARLYEERTRAHGELAAAQDQLVRTEKLRAMGEMASGVAHDFNNVLAAVLGRAQLLLGQVADPKLRQWIQVIERAALDGARTVRRLQDFTRVRRDHPVVVVDLNSIVQQTLEATESAWLQESRRRGIQIEVETALAVPLPGISGDPAELREALTNLILNALDAMPGGGKLTLATTADEEVEIAVTDTGTGIAADIRNRIFDPFFTTKGPKGTGLGLSMTYGILARHGARISVESEEGHGTRFRLFFPAATETVAPAEPEPALATAPPLHCLVVDDEEAVAEVLGDMLIAAGHSVAVVGSGGEAIARVNAETFDVVVTDLAMPGMTGWEVARAVKRVAPGVRVILASGFGVEVSPEDLRTHGVDLVLAKPLRLQDIESAIAMARSARVEPSEEAAPAPSE